MAVQQQLLQRCPSSVSWHSHYCRYYCPCSASASASASSLHCWSWSPCCCHLDSSPAEYYCRCYSGVRRRMRMAMRAMMWGPCSKWSSICPPESPVHGAVCRCHPVWTGRCVMCGDGDGDGDGGGARTTMLRMSTRMTMLTAMISNVSVPL